jgi:hypothetical protein
MQIERTAGIRYIPELNSKALFTHPPEIFQANLVDA